MIFIFEGLYDSNQQYTELREKPIEVGSTYKYFHKYSYIN